MNLKDEALGAIIDSLDGDPGDWTYPSVDRKYTIKHKSGVEVWVSNGNAYLYQPNIVHFGFFATIRLRRAYKRWAKVRGEDIGKAAETACLYAVIQALV